MCDSPGKHPLTANGLLDATTDEKQLAKWWRVNPQANLAVATGETSGSSSSTSTPTKAARIRCWNWKKSTAYRLRRLKSQPAAAAAPLLSYPAGVKIHSRNGWLPGIDVKADGGYVIAPPSNHIKGRVPLGGRMPAGEVELAEMPPWLLELLPRKDERRDATTNGKPAANGTHTFTVTDGGASLLHRAQAYVAAAEAASEGNRNDAAFRLAGHVAALDDNGSRLE